MERHDLLDAIDAMRGLMEAHDRATTALAKIGYDLIPNLGLQRREPPANQIPMTDDIKIREMMVGIRNRQRGFTR